MFNFQNRDFVKVVIKFLRKINKYIEFKKEEKYIYFLENKNRFCRI